MLMILNMYRRWSECMLVSRGVNAMVFVMTGKSDRALRDYFSGHV